MDSRVWNNIQSHRCLSERNPKYFEVFISVITIRELQLKDKTFCLKKKKWFILVFILKKKKTTSKFTNYITYISIFIFFAPMKLRFKIWTQNNNPLEAYIQLFQNIHNLKVLNISWEHNFKITKMVLGMELGILEGNGKELLQLL